MIEWLDQIRLNDHIYTARSANSSVVLITVVQQELTEKFGFKPRSNDRLPQPTSRATFSAMCHHAVGIKNTNNYL